MSNDHIIIYYSDHATVARIEVNDRREPGWWWCMANFDPCGPFESKEEAVRSLLEEIENAR